MDKERKARRSLGKERAYADENEEPRQSGDQGEDTDDAGSEPSLALLQIRRGSEMSNASSSQAGPSSMASLGIRRTSLSSFASSTGSPRPTVSTFSHATGGTAGDLSTASLPLLQGMTALNQSLDNHSYPPPLSRNRNRTGTASSRESDRQLRSKRSTTFSGKTGLPPVTNPLAPLRKRLRRSLTASANKRVAIEIQLLVELIDALDALVVASTSTSESHSESPHKTQESLEEVELLVQELVEVAPDAGRCLINGRYGPLSGGTSIRRDSYDPSWSEWWPRRLARDCRAVLDELGFPSSMLSIFATPLEDDKSLLNFSPTTTPDLQSAGKESDKRFDDDVMKKQRQEELLAEGKKRWQQYLAQVQAS